jgi:hypothetical protein
MSCCRSNSIGKGFCWLFLILLCVGLVVAWPDIKRYLKISKM